MVAKGKGLGKVRVKSVKRIILSAGVLIAAVIAALVIFNNVFSSKSKEVSVEPVPTPTASEKNVDSKADIKEENFKIANVETTDSSDKEAMKAVGEAIIKNKDISVKVINYTRISGLAEKVRVALELNGFVVSAGNDNSLKSISSVVIEKKENVSGEWIKNLLDIKKVRKELDPQSRFDILVILGDDYKS
ncbi:LytR C-terminal domain-containing protein [Acetivibrio cellulolyticus]|uniref:LytR C-terminal domain-containing protein n=1 Tax=Acetivibrio cellulolyticus TaxID=35830 RepID=UPI0001E30576|nr:LytR C-terminal domain-containing protein [Acetivibrio cellulolyticus]